MRDRAADYLLVRAQLISKPQRPDRPDRVAVFGHSQTGILPSGKRAPDRLLTRLAQPEVPHLSRVDEFLHHAGDVFDGHRRVRAVLVQQGRYRTI
jgi:hypothetical protein